MTETLGSYFANISSDNNYTREFKQYKNTREATPIPFNTPNNLSLNEPFKLDEFNNILQPSKNSTPGEDTIPYELYKRLPNTEKQKLMDFFNFLWINHKFPEQWRNAHAMPILKPNKPPSSTNSY